MLLKTHFLAWNVAFEKIKVGCVAFEKIKVGYFIPSKLWKKNVDEMYFNFKGTKRQSKALF